VKCRTRRALDFWPHIAASGLSRGFVCLRVGMTLKSLFKSVLIEYAILSRPRQTHATSDQVDALSFKHRRSTAQHYTLCCVYCLNDLFYTFNQSVLEPDLNFSVDLRSSEITRLI